jgi:hypothetical protein
MNAPTNPPARSWEKSPTECTATNPRLLDHVQGHEMAPPRTGLAITVRAVRGLRPRSHGVFLGHEMAAVDGVMIYVRCPGFRHRGGVMTECCAAIAEQRWPLSATDYRRPDWPDPGEYRTDRWADNRRRSKRIATIGAGARSLSNRSPSVDLLGVIVRIRGHREKPDR